ncbi:type IV conjugative transfer system protein TraL [Shimia sp. FJ5]|uniref:type IV conjugative transfer system protein TraL n=1 Tax=Shimia sp. FJ5 TaxID=3079054 RepID=UPI00293DC0BA|nr:type IV conjugative transfer system protein TraL [Shimia sp. FJ5]MDV4146436.1 type IV conjugative transfer system protein TraL [Shimia sp. FJ5]
MTDVVKVEQRLQDAPQFFVLPADEAVAAIAPFLIGILAKKLFLGVGLAVISYFIWKRVKGERGLPGLVAAIYWILPREVTPYRSFPDSAVSTWRA